MRVDELRFKIYPQDFSVTRAFYKDRLALPVRYEWDNGGRDRGVMFEAGGAVIEVLGNRESLTGAARYGLSLAVSDVKDLWESFKNDRRVVFALRHNEWGDTSFKITDPDGLEITFFTRDELPRQTTLVFLVRKKDGLISEVCLARKKRGFGAQKWNGVGGKLEPGETAEQAAEREAHEEIGVSIRKMSKCAELEFVYLHEPSWNQLVCVYLADGWVGNPCETEEMAPQWFKVSDIPFSQMWSDDSIWLPRVLSGESITGRFVFDGENIKECRVESIAFL